MSTVTLDPVGRLAVRLGSALERWGRARTADSLPDREAMQREVLRQRGIESRRRAAEARALRPL